jgi:transitional endoplasmic reticulum ATPase
MFLSRLLVCESRFVKVDSSPSSPASRRELLRMATDPLIALKEALRLSPNNIPLRQHLADSLLSAGRADEAEQEYRDALNLAPNSVPLRIGLARTYFRLGKNSHALVIAEDLVGNPGAPGTAFVLHARLLAGTGDVPKAIEEYRRGVELDAAAADPEFEQRLGINLALEELAESEVVEGRLRAGWGDDEEKPPASGIEMEKPKISFVDVGGMEAVKEQIELKIIAPLKHPDLYKAYGKKMGGGILLYGPPGCGKTYLARATAGEIKASFLSVGINDVLDMWIGNSERNLHGLFEEARSNTPSVLFFDEVDALGASRSDMRQHSGRQLINQFLAEMDGVEASNEGVLILAATNAPWHLDSAFRRPGRFDRILFVPPPDAEARARILELMLKGKPQEKIDLKQLAKKTEHFSGADLKAVVDIAIEKKLQTAMKEGTPRPLTTIDLITAAAVQKPTTREWFATARNYALYSNQGGAYDEITKYLKAYKVI